MRRCTVTTADGGRCQDEHKARGLCLRHYAQSDRRRRKADATKDDWDWRAGVPDHQPPAAPGSDFTETARCDAESVAAASPPGRSPGYAPPDDPSTPPPNVTEGDGGPVSRSVAAVIARIPADKRQDPTPVLARALARLMDENPTSATSRELRAVMKEVTAMAAVQEVSALGRIRDELAARRAARASEASA
ncbi:hypothetical protein [Euzebya sp.]|uniref:hypothetical protein n=1 Tax=Euzebya sp. TaxID=1971409 RepID=UPI0035177546